MQFKKLTQKWKKKNNTPLNKQLPEKHNKPLCYSATDYIQTTQIFLLKNGRIFTLEGTQIILQCSSLSYLLRFPTWFYNAFYPLLIARNCSAFFPSLPTIPWAQRLRVFVAWLTGPSALCMEGAQEMWRAALALHPHPSAQPVNTTRKCSPCCVNKTSFNHS